MKKYFIKILAPLIVVVIVLCTFGGYVIYKKLELRNNCTRIHSGNVAVEVMHKGRKIGTGGDGATIDLDIYDSNEKDSLVTLRLDDYYIKSVDELMSEGDVGPSYSKVMFNDYESAFYSLPDEVTGKTLDHYQVFSGNRRLNIFIQKSIEDRDNFDFSNIKIVNTKDDIKEARVEECGINN